MAQGAQARTPGTAPPTQRHGALALALQESITVIVRLRSNRQAVSDAASFRNHIRQALRMAEQEARKGGYSGEDIRLGIFAVVAFLDESVLNSRNPLFADWPRQPLQEELFKHHVAGEVFFQELQQLLQRDDSDSLGDVLEVYQICLLLGFRGRYSVAGQGELQAIMSAVAEKIRRIRGGFGELSPNWKLPQQGAIIRKDPWFRRLVFIAAGCFLLALSLFIVYKLTLRSGISDIESRVTVTKR